MRIVSTKITQLNNDEVRKEIDQGPAVNVIN